MLQKTGINTLSSLASCIYGIDYQGFARRNLEQQSIELPSICVSTADLIQHSTMPYVTGTQETARRILGNTAALQQRNRKKTARRNRKAEKILVKTTALQQRKQ